MSAVPLLVPSSGNDDNNEDDEILHLTQTQPFQPSKTKLAAALIALSVVIVGSLSVAVRSWHSAPEQVNVILMVSDGFGPASETFAREFYGYINNINPKDHFMFPLDHLLVGSSRTRSSSSLVTDSAAGATAFSCGIKSYNGAISVSPDDVEPCGTVLEAAKFAGFSTGLVATSRITHATPACFYAHVPSRDMESKIASFLVGNGPLGQLVDLSLGGGRCFFLPNTTAGGASCRNNDEDLISVAKSRGFNVAMSMKDLKADGSVLELPYLGLFNRDHMNYEIDRHQITDPDLQEPALKDMAKIALESLEAHVKAKGNKGFFLMVEGSRIDMAAHSNDPANHARDIIQYQETVSVVKEFVDNSNKKKGTKTLMISVSDHETGGLSCASQIDPDVYPIYNWYPAALANVTHSTIYLASQISAQSDANTLTQDWISEEILKKGLDIHDHTEKEMEKVLKYQGDKEVLDKILAHMSSQRAQLGWATHGHSAVDVNLYAHPRTLAPTFQGSIENSDIGGFIADFMGVSLAPITARLKAASKAETENLSPKAVEEAVAQQGVLDQEDSGNVSHYHCSKCQGRHARIQKEYL